MQDHKVTKQMAQGSVFIILGICLLVGCTDNDAPNSPTNDNSDAGTGMQAMIDADSAPDMQLPDTETPTGDQDVTMTADAQTPTDMSAEDMNIVDAEIIVDAAPIVDAEPPTPVIPCNSL